jgi:hypothetical protein
VALLAGTDALAAKSAGAGTSAEDAQIPQHVTRRRT